jgi:hypothetical protein
MSILLFLSVKETGKYLYKIDSIGEHTVTTAIIMLLFYLPPNREVHERLASETIQKFTHASHVRGSQKFSSRRHLEAYIVSFQDRLRDAGHVGAGKIGSGWERGRSEELQLCNGLLVRHFRAEFDVPEKVYVMN